jgi:hypothetical protein
MKKTLKGVRLFDPRIGKFRKPGNSNPALIMRDLLIRGGWEPTREDDQLIKKLADFCDEEILAISAVLPKLTFRQ